MFYRDDSNLVVKGKTVKINKNVTALLLELSQDEAHVRLDGKIEGCSATVASTIRALRRRNLAWIVEVHGKNVERSPRLNIVSRGRANLSPETAEEIAAKKSPRNTCQKCGKTLNSRNAGPLCNQCMPKESPDETD